METQYGNWIAAPGNGVDYLIVSKGDTLDIQPYNSSVTTTSGYAFRPVVCLKEGVDVVSNGDGTYKLQVIS